MRSPFAAPAAVVAAARHPAPRAEVDVVIPAGVPAWLLAVVVAAFAPSVAAQAVPSVPDGLSASRAAPGADSALPLAELVERAWTLARGGASAQARAAELDARAVAVAATFAGPPSLEFSVRRDLPVWAALPGTEVSPERGTNELEPGVSVPLWLPGQREAERRRLERDRGRLAAATRAARLAVAGEVREATWAMALAQVGARVLAAREASSAALEADVARRVAAGDLAPVDLMSARAERLAAAAAAREADAAVRVAAARLRALAGTDALGELREPPRESPEVGARSNADPLDAHPAVAAAREALDAARARLDAAGVARRDNPLVAAVARFERDVTGGPYRNTLRIGIAVPLDTEARNAPRLAAAGVELTDAQIALERERRERAAAIERARIEVDAARRTLEAGAERAAVSRDARLALERAFRAGERGLPDVLRARAVADDAELARELARGRLDLAIARLNQSLGFEP